MILLLIAFYSLHIAHIRIIIMIHTNLYLSFSSSFMFHEKRKHKNNTFEFRIPYHLSFTIYGLKVYVLCIPNPHLSSHSHTRSTQIHSIQQNTYDIRHILAVSKRNRWRYICCKLFIFVTMIQ